MVWLQVMSLITTIVMIFLGALLLWITAKYIFKLENKTYKTALIVAAIAGVASFIFGLVGLSGTISLILGILIGLFLIQRLYKLDWGKAALVWLVWFVMEIVAGLIVGFIIGLLMAPLLVGEVVAALA